MAFDLGGGGGGGVGIRGLNGDDPEQRRAYKTSFGGVDRYVNDMDEEQARLRRIEEKKQAARAADHRARERARLRSGGCLWSVGAAQAVHWALGRRLAAALVGERPDERKKPAPRPCSPANRSDDGTAGLTASAPASPCAGASDSSR
eukprot:TRINITY_DN2541_c0_g1_i1.p1 TRINITY_DN2541_c0_g1~~TRINITY_DN2541_c0_g1_i1.p1  ORF type:complete len:166 (+),score=73.85 TRINITY_DN2541_c0_g1_i1:59-499(+)